MNKPYSRNSEVTDVSFFPQGMQRFAMGIEYRGDFFRGFQTQSSDVPTVQQALEKALSDICDETIGLVCAGRTDRGVHATNQVIHFDTLAKRPERAWLGGANTRLPDGVSIRWVREVSPLFHARFSAVSRVYRYLVYNSPTPSALMKGLTTRDCRRLDIESMIHGSRCLIGEHDFTAFRGADCQARNPVRRLEKLDIQRWQDFIVIEVKATAFLYHMVRNIVGVLLAVGAGEKSAPWIASVLASRDRRCGGVTAPADGLYLVGVDYDSEYALPQRDKGPFWIAGFDC